MSDTFKMECPKCGQHIECPNELYNQPVPCPTCREQVLAAPSVALDPPRDHSEPPIVPQKSEIGKPPLWNILALVKYHRDRRRVQQALIRESRCKYIASVLDLIRSGEWALSIENVVLLRNEKVLWNEPAILYEWKTVGRHYETTFLSSRGKRVIEKAETAVAEGNFIITDQRLIFSSEEQSFSVKPEKLLNIHLYPDGIRFAQDGRKQARALKFPSKNGDIIQAILNLTFGATP